MKTSCCILSFLLVTLFASAQNLVLNPSFETGATCDGTTERIDTVDYWQPIAGRPSFINSNCPLTRASLSFVHGMKLPPAGHGDVLAIQRFDTKGEFQQGQLKEPLEAGVLYIVKMWVRLPIKFSNQPINEIGVALTSTPLEVSEEKRSIDIPALALKNSNQSAIKNQYEWEEVSTTYTAKGGEQYIAIGNFSSTNQGLFEKRAKKEATYVFIDALSVYKFKEITLPNYASSAPLEQGKRLLLNEVIFETQADVLQSSSLNSLKKLAKMLKDNSNIKIELTSYTDNSMSPSESLTLSQARAKALTSYLQKQGVLISQIKSSGKGNANAIALNDTEKGRQKNDRIELVFTEF